MRKNQHNTISNRGLVAARILKRMKDAKISQAELAKKIGTTQSSISKMLGGEQETLNAKTIEDICNVLNLDFEEVTSVKNIKEDDTLNVDEYERGLVSWLLDKYGVDITHVKVCGSIVFRSNKYSNYLYSNGLDLYTHDEMEKHEKKERQIFAEEELDGVFEEYYELQYRNEIIKMTVDNYHTFIDSFNKDILFKLMLLFRYK